MKLSLRTCTRVIHLSRYIDFLRIFDTIISLVFDGLEKARVLLEKFTLVVPRMTRLTLTILSCLFACLANQWSVNRYPWIIIMNVVITGANNWSMNVNMMIKAFTFLHSPTFILTDVYTLQHNKQLCVCLKGASLFGITESKLSLIRKKESLSIIKARATVDADRVDYYLLFFKWRQE